MLSEINQAWDNNLCVFPLHGGDWKVGFEEIEHRIVVTRAWEGCVCEQ